MASLDDNKSADRSTMMLIGNNGTGKSGALASLALAGYKLRIIDSDNGTEILKNVLTPSPGRKLYTQFTDKELDAARARIDVESAQDTYVNVGGKPMAKVPLRGFARTCELLDNWPGLGKPNTWGPDTVLVLDSLTLNGKFIMNHVMNLNLKLGQQPSQPNWGTAQQLQEELMQMLTGAGMRCHVIVTAHISFQTEDGAISAQGFPSALGKALPPRIGSYFNSLLHADKDVAGKKIIRTITKDIINCKTSAPGKVKDTYPLETGLADYFAAVYGPLKVETPPVVQP